MTMQVIWEAFLILLGATTLTLALTYGWLRLSAFCAGQEW